MTQRGRPDPRLRARLPNDDTVRRDTVRRGIGLYRRAGQTSRMALSSAAAAAAV
jgi:hypothetical protein